MRPRKDYETRQLPCKHIFAVEFVIEREKPTGISSPPRSRTTARGRPLRRSSAQAKAEEADLQAELAGLQQGPDDGEASASRSCLHDLCRGIVEPPKPHGGVKGGRGPSPVPMADMRVFAVGHVFKVYTTMSGRRSTCDLKDAEARGYINQAPHFNSVSRFMESPELTPILGDLIRRERLLPLRAVEVSTSPSIRRGSARPGSSGGSTRNTGSSGNDPSSSRCRS